MTSIKHWPLSERPREKLLALGAKHLTDAELLAIFLNTGTKGKSALTLAQELISEFKSLKKLLQAPPDCLYAKRGLGQAKYALLQAGIELGRRYSEAALPLGEKLNNPLQTKQFLQSRLRDYSYEVVACLFLDAKHRLLAFEELFHGTLTEAHVYPREIIKRSLVHNAANIILAHNHPSGDSTPSTTDQALTLFLKQALALVDIHLIDHIIVGHDTCLSLAEAGQI